MRPLNRPMFKMGGPVKEGIMDGIREPKADGGNIGGGIIEGRPAGKGRTGFNVVTIGGNILARTAPFLSKARTGIGSFFKSTKPPQFTPAPSGTYTSMLPNFVQKYLIPSGRFRQPAIPKDQVIPGKFKPAPLSLREIVTSPRTLFTAARENPGTAFLLGGQIKNLKGIAEGDDELILGKVRNLGVDAVQGAANYLLGTEFGKELEIEGDGKEKAELPGQDQKGGANVDSKVEVNEQGGSAPSNQFNDDGTKKDISVERLLKGIVKRARTDAAADTAIKFGQQLRTGEASIKDPSSVIDVASGEFDKVSDLQEKVDLALIENELKKQQIAAQATATTEKALEIEKRKRGMITMGDLVRADKSGMGLTHSGTLGIAREFADLTGKKYRGSIGNDDLLAKFEKNDRFKTDELGVITEKLQGGDDGLYILGTRVYEKSGPIVKLIKT